MGIVRTDKTERLALHESSHQGLCPPLQNFEHHALFSPAFPVAFSGNLYPHHIFVKGAVHIRSRDEDILRFSLNAHKAESPRMGGEHAGEILIFRLHIFAPGGKFHAAVSQERIQHFFQLFLLFVRNIHEIGHLLKL